MKIKILLYKSFLILLLFSFKEIQANEEDKLETIQILQSSELALKKLISNEDIINLKKFLKNSKAILIFPEVYEGGLVFGAKGGNGLLIIKRNDDKFSGPFFFSLGGVSIGLQVGAKSGMFEVDLE